MVQAVIFDMDGVIINSEPFWREAEMEVFNKIGVKMTEEMCIEMKGTKIDDVVKHWYSLYPWKDVALKDVESQVIEKVNNLIWEKGEPMTGLMGLLEYLRSNNIKIGLATSSLFSIMDVVLDKLRIRDYFDVMHSAEAEKAGKPAPDVYIGAAAKLGVAPEYCVAIEDSYTGLLSARSAGMFTIALPEAPEFNAKKYDIADIKIKSLKEVIQLDVISKFLTVS